MILASEGGHDEPTLVSFVNSTIGEPLYQFQVKYTKPLWDNYVFANFDTTAEKVFGAYTPENAVPWYTVMFILACIVSLVLVWILRGRGNDDVPEDGQQILEVGLGSIRNLLTDLVGEHGMKYFPIIATFGVLILVSNLFGFIPGLLPPTASVNVTFALGITSFVYYNYIGIKENGLFGHLRHFAGPVLLIAPLLFIIEIISNLVRPFSLGVRLFGNIFADEQVLFNISNLYAPWTLFVLPVLIMPLGLFVAFVQSFIFIFLSMMYIAEVSHAPHDDHGHATDGQAEHAHAPTADGEGVSLTAPV
jgi:F-type H+-transporting ATPase subunit a